MSNKDLEMNNFPPKYAEKLLRIFLPKREREFLLGDYAFLYDELRRHNAKYKADLWYWNHVVKSISVS